MPIHETLKNNERIDRWRRKARPAAIEQQHKSCAAVQVIWNSVGPLPWKVHELRLIRSTVPVEAVFEMNLLIDLLENYL